MILGLSLSVFLIPLAGHRDKPALIERLRISSGLAVMMISVQYSIMLLKSQTPVSEPYEVKGTGQQDQKIKSPIWTLAIGCWFLSLGVGLTIVGVLSIVVEGGRWKFEMQNKQKRGRMKDLDPEPLCP